MQVSADQAKEMLPSSCATCMLKQPTVLPGRLIPLSKLARCGTATRDLADRHLPAAHLEQAGQPPSVGRSRPRRNAVLLDADCTELHSLGDWLMYIELTCHYRAATEVQNSSAERCRTDWQIAD